MIMKVNYCSGLLFNQLIHYEDNLLLHTEPWGCVCPLVLRLQTASFQTAVCNGVWREKCKATTQRPQCLHSCTLTTLLTHNQGRNMAEITDTKLFLCTVSAHRSGCVIFATCLFIFVLKFRHWQYLENSM